MKKTLDWAFVAAASVAIVLNGLLAFELLRPDLQLDGLLPRDLLFHLPGLAYGSAALAAALASGVVASQVLPIWIAWLAVPAVGFMGLYGLVMGLRALTGDLLTVQTPALAASPSALVGPAVWIGTALVLATVCVALAVRYGPRSPLGAAAIMVFVASLPCLFNAYDIHRVFARPGAGAAFFDTMAVATTPTVLAMLVSLLALVCLTPMARERGRLRGATIVLGLAAFVPLVIQMFYSAMMGIAGMPLAYIDYPAAYDQFWRPHGIAHLTLLALGVMLLLRPRLAHRYDDADVFA